MVHEPCVVYRLLIDELLLCYRNNFWTRTSLSLFCRDVSGLVHVYSLSIFIIEDNGSGSSGSLRDPDDKVTLHSIRRRMVSEPEDTSIPLILTNRKEGIGVCFRSVDVCVLRPTPPPCTLHSSPLPSDHISSPLSFYRVLLNLSIWISYKFGLPRNL